MNKLNIDITNTIDRIIDLIVDIMRWVWLKLQSVEFWGTNLLMVTITITIIMTIIPIIFTIVNNAGSAGASAINGEIRRRQNAEEKRTREIESYQKWKSGGFKSGKERS